MPILARLRISVIFKDFQKAVETSFLGISKIPPVKFEIHSFPCYLFKSFCFPVT